MKTPKRNESAWLTALSIGGAGVMLAVYIIIGYFAGKWLAQVLDGPKIWLAAGMISGMCLGIVNIIYFVKKFMGEQDE
ncbi:AtpZ/AtpI family protein [Paenibacillus apiarius]|uniref:AtpZ/AtpI family protein n=1 Tax=Paenibacillus apiarius TaxID=46240 RepID=A0ABT4DSZ1_9BACL|nr:AtpZ/AtpI family protein [Paenibacillus apiarius]MBN3523934.1 AtpZ/AtpI family protein [Paenibacillus apiarius]MCY9514247.1 AtpZ/AtpI family protein [Paenibacillus apiarius]MCY9520370.1 AtpZ/AtpI family protein [Paenibacillus apiarius]MCY9554733.1 AtpZ/AtpI family protein [Paenibacillus apiarius]MCY9557350.1 AtpZ/AtpI family protein [Paenibacillus apiarius]